MMYRIFICFFIISVSFLFAEDQTESAQKTLRKAVGFYREHVAAEGGYLWKYSADLSLREGENVADAQTVWVQPPGTPTIGLTLLKAYRVTGDTYYLDAARDAGNCLVRGQLRSGGWTYSIYFDEEQRRKYSYRVDPVRSSKSTKNVSTLDDNTTQSAIAFLMELDEALEFSDSKIHETAVYALEKLLETQFPNGAFPQGFSGEKRDDTAYPVKPANYPPEGTEPTHEKDYYKYYTFNDNLAWDLNRVFFMASEIYGTKKDGKLNLNEKYVNAACCLGDFMILAQMPEPQPAWAQQYDFEMRPCWARKFEPASITGGESQGIITALIELFLFTGNKKYLEPIPKAVAYLEHSRRSDGKLARFYEMQTNKPLYFTKSYELTYSEADMPTHYAFVIDFNSSRLNQLLKQIKSDRLKQLEIFRNNYRNLRLPQSKAQDVAAVIAGIDQRGAWVTSGILNAAKSNKKIQIIDNTVFVKNINILLGFLNTGSKTETIIDPKN
ncbi:MAG: pectic acid lyase [Planctomycetaceae bacterium]|jgi:PelA/Pel-15E family pectate lyase|nr:pectic acid lyase [Planctomycetaceae bacterium]